MSEIPGQIPEQELSGAQKNATEQRSKNDVKLVREGADIAKSGALIPTYKQFLDAWVDMIIDKQDTMTDRSIVINHGKTVEMRSEGSLVRETRTFSESEIREVISDYEGGEIRPEDLRVERILTDEKGNLLSAIFSLEEATSWDHFGGYVMYRYNLSHVKNVPDSTAHLQTYIERSLINEEIRREVEDKNALITWGTPEEAEQARADLLSIKSAQRNEIIARYSGDEWIL